MEKAHQISVDELQPLYDEMSKVWGINLETLNLDTANQYLDSYIMIKIENKSIDNDLSPSGQELVHKYFWYLFYEGTYGDPQTAQLASTEFLNYVINTFKAKVSAHKNETDVPEFYKNIRHVYFSAHDTTIGAFLAALELQHTQKSLPPLASLNLIELYKKGEKYYLNWNMNGEFLNINDKCSAQGDCELTLALDFFASKTIPDLEKS